jgi:lysophospholipase L1-like esterase
VLAPPLATLAGGPRPAGRVVVCLGDSITRGRASADWVGQLQARRGQSGLTMVNAGVDGDLAWSALQRLDAVVALRPDVVILLIGTNDVAACAGPEAAQAFRDTRQLPAEVTPTLEWYEENVAAILDRLASETDASVAIVELPPAGEDLAAQENLTTERYNAVLRRLADARALPVLPLFARLTAMLPAGHQPPDRRRISRIGRSSVRRRLLRQSWDQISAARGLLLLHDHVHLNDRSGAVLAELVDQLLDAAPPAIEGRHTDGRRTPPGVVRGSPGTGRTADGTEPGDLDGYHSGRGHEP